jgi:hypothetical protein
MDPFYFLSFADAVAILAIRYDLRCSTSFWGKIVLPIAADELHVTQG